MAENVDRSSNQQVARFSHWCSASHGHEMLPSEVGAWVRFSDYSALTARVAELEQYLMRIDVCSMDKEFMRKLAGEALYGKRLGVETTATLGARVSGEDSAGPTTESSRPPELPPEPTTTTKEWPPVTGLAEGFGDPTSLWNSRQWLRKALEAKGAKQVGAGIGCGQADIDIILEGCKFNVSIRPL